MDLKGDNNKFKGTGMKHNVLIILLMGISTAWGQTSSQAQALHFCGEKIPVPSGCQADSDYELMCDDFSIQWMYLEEDMLGFVPQQYVNQLDERLKKFRKRNIKLVSLGTELEGYLVSHKNDKVIKYKIIGYGIINQQPVLIHLSLRNEPRDNDALPNEVKQFVTLR